MSQIPLLTANNDVAQVKVQRKLRKVVTYHENGFVKEEYSVLDEQPGFSDESSKEHVKHGYYKQYFDTGVLKLTHRYVDGSLQGVSAEFHPNGQKKVYKQVKDGKLHGLYTVYSPVGRLLQSSYYSKRILCWSSP